MNRRKFFQFGAATAAAPLVLKGALNEETALKSVSGLPRVTLGDSGEVWLSAPEYVEADCTISTAASGWEFRDGYWRRD